MKRLLKTFFLAFTVLLAATAAWAHGPVSGQAAFAAKKVSELFVASEPASVQERFQSMSIELIGEEMFLVRVSLKNESKTFDYQCGLDAKAKPVTWGCKKK